MTENPNAKNITGRNPIYYTASNGHTEIVKILATLTYVPYVPCTDGTAPIHWIENIIIMYIQNLGPLDIYSTFLMLQKTMDGLRALSGILKVVGPAKKKNFFGGREGGVACFF